MKKRRKTKLWKKVLVGFMSITMFLGNLSTLSIEAYAATEDVLMDEGEPEADDYEVTPPVVEELEDEYDYAEEEAEVIYYTVTYYDADGTLLGSSQFAEGSGLSLPAAAEGAYWTDADGIEYVDGDEVYDDLSLFANVDDIDTDDDIDEDLPEDQVLVYAVLVDTEGTVLDEFRITEDMYLASDEDNDAPVIDGYDFTEAILDMSTVTEILVDETEDGLLVYTVDGVELEADADIQLVYESNRFDYNVSFEVVDEDGAVIKGYETVETPEIDGTLDLADADNAPVEVEGYEYVGASIAGEDVYSVSIEANDAYYETDNGFVDIESDLLITLTYAELAVPTVLTATIVDEFGDEIDEQYTEMELPEFDEEGILVLDDPELPPVEDVKVKTGLFRSIKYTYVKSTIDNKIVTAIKAEEAAGGLGTCYSYTTDGETWIKLKEDSTVLFEYSDGKKTTYTYEDGYVSVTATLQHANAIPDDAYFAVTPLTEGSGYDVETYIDALNAKADTPEDADDFEYSTSNTLLYDIAFYTDETMTEEIEPADGMVKTEITFLQNQLKDELEADDKAELMVNHLSLDESVIEEAGTTANASVTIGSLNVETIAADVSVAGESVAFTTEGYSVFTISSPSLEKKIKISFQTADGAPVSADKLPDAYLYVYKVSDTNQHALIKLDGSIGEFENGVITISADELKSSSLRSFTYGSDFYSLYGVEIWQAVSPEKASSASIDSSYDKNNFIKRVPITETGEVPELVDMYRFNFPLDDFSSSNPDYEITATQVAVGAYTDAPSMMGEAAGFGVIADTYYSHADTQTNFAVKKFIGRAPGDRGATGADMANNPGTSYAGEIENVLQVKVNLGPSNIFYGDSFRQESNGDQQLYYKENGDLFIQDDSGKALVATLPVEMINGKVDSLIAGISIPGGEMITLPGAASDVSSAPYYLDTSKLPGGTIHIDLDSSAGDGISMYDVWSTSQNVYINKNSDQTIVFHSSMPSVKLYEYNVCNDGSGSYMTTASPASAGETNDKLADVCNTIVFDLPNATSVEFASAVAGMFYAPNARVDWHTACCGWLICDYAAGVDGEWHFIYQNVPDIEEIDPDDNTNTATLEFYLTKHLIDDRTGGIADTAVWPESGFSFKISKYPCNDPGDINATELGVIDDIDLIPTLSGMDENGEMIVTIGRDQAETPVLVGTADFVGSEVWNSTAGVQSWYEHDVLDHKYMAFMYKVEEIDPENPNYTIDRKPYYVKFFVNVNRVLEGNTVKYYASVNGPHIANTVAAGTQCREIPLELTNHYLPSSETGAIRLTKRLEGKDSAENVMYRFRVFGQDSTRFPVSYHHADLSFTSSTGRTVSYDMVTNDSINGQEREIFYFDLYADETVTISGLPAISQGHRADGSAIPNEYIIQEVDGRSDADEVYVESLENTQAAGWNDTGFALDVLTKDFYDNRSASITYVNVYYSKLVIEKSIVGYENLTDEQKHQITFTVTGPSFDEPAVITYDQFTDGKYEFDHLERGTYTVTESGQDIDPGYICETTYSDDGTVTIDGDHPGTLTVTNTYINNTTSVSGSKTWRDGNDQDGLRPSSITITLLANGQPATGVEPLTVTPDEAGNWSWSFDNLPKYGSNGREIAYTVTETAVDGYVTTYTADHLSVINTHVPEETSVKVQKVWNGDENNTQFRPASITVDLLADGEVVDTKSLSAGNGWKCTFTGLPKYVDGREIVYTISEVAVDKYDTDVTGDAAEGYTITNTYVPEYVQIHGTKVWDDESDFDGSRPEQIVLRLYADGTEKYSKTIKASDYAAGADIWDWDFNEYQLDKYSGGNEIAYTVTEDALYGEYSTSYTQVAAVGGHYDYENNGIVITNSYTPGKTSVSGSKTWSDNNDQDGIRPDHINISLIKTVGVSESVYDTRTVTAADGWSWSWDNLPVKENNAPISWSISEEAVPGYDTQISGYNVTNTHETAKVKIGGFKSWDDANDQDGLRESVTIGLYKGEAQIATTEATAAGNWLWSFDNLDKYEGGNLITYTVKELTHITGYDVTPENGEITVALAEDTTEVEGLEFVNTHTPYVVNISGTKVWDDAENQDGLRPSTISIELLANGVRVRTAEVPNVDGKWEFAFYNLPKKSGGVNIEYTVRETNVPAGYTVSYVQPGSTSNETCSITNTHVPATIDIRGSKTWVDSDDQDGKRPESITVNLLADGTVKDTVTVTPDEKGDWKYEFTGLPEKANGTTINYTITEDEVTYYDTVVNGYNITNTHSPEKISISGGKRWVDADDQDGLQPDNITIELYYEGQEDPTIPYRSVTTSADNDWRWSFVNLDKYADGEKIVYIVKEAPVEGYVTSPAEGFTATSSDPDASDNLTGLVFTNTHTPEKTQISVTKVWDDAENQDGKRPAEITVNLLANGTGIDSATLSKDNGWSHTFSDLDKKSGGEDIVYTISEEEISGYTPAYASSTDEEGYPVWTITNSYSPESTYVSGQKIWHDGDNQDGMRPQQITIILKADGVEVKRASTYANKGWAWSFNDLPKYKNGKEIQYSIEEVAIDGYTATISNVDGKTNEYIIDNTHKPETISVSGGKNWDDANNQDGVRPSGITVKLNATNVAMEERTATAEAPDYEWIFENLPRYQNGVEVQYVATEVQSDELTANNYTLTDTTPASYDSDGNYKGIVFTNTHVPATVEISGSKDWDDEDDQDGIRPDSIQIQLYANGVKSGAPKTVTAGDDDSWSWSFTDLPRFEAGKSGKEITYTVEEILPEGLDYKLTATDPGSYDATTGNKTGIVFTNTHTPDTMSIYGTKNWVDGNDQDGKRPEYITIILYKSVGGAPSVKAGQTNASAETNWEWYFEKLPKFDGGKPIQYSVEETGIPAGYTGSMTKAGTENEAGDTVGVEFTNTHIPETTSISGTKVWDDAHDQDGARPDSITINLYQNNDTTVFRTLTLTPDDKSADTWNWQFDDLPKYSGGQLATYRVEEVAVGGYLAPTYSEDGRTITNKRVPSVVEVKGVKAWNDVHNQDGKRPGSITIHLLADGTDTGKSVTLTEETGWEFAFTGLPKCNNGSKITYTVSEDEVEGYTTVISGNANIDSPYYTVTNSYDPGKVAVSGIKDWNDDDNKDGLRPGSITIRLLANGTEVSSCIARASDGYAWSFEGLDEYAAGKKIEYTVTEDEVPGYTTQITQTGTNQWTVKNTHETEKISIEGEKHWNDASNQDGVRPASIKVNLLADGHVVQSRTVTADDNWSYSFDNLDKFRDHGTEIVYSVSEDAILIPAGHANLYQVSVDGYDITNTYIPETVEIEGHKTWDDAGNQDGVRPESITVYLKVNGSISQTLTVPVADDGSASWKFENLPKYADGKLITYSIDEEPVSQYVKSINGYNLVNTHTPQLTDIHGTKVWNDADDQDGVRPDRITVQLMANGAAVEGRTAVVSADTNWSFEFKDLPMFDGGNAIIYSVEESDVSGYTVSYSGAGTYDLTVTNTHDPEYVGLRLNKKWLGGIATADSVQISIEGRTDDGSVVVPAQTYKVGKPGWTLEITPESKTLPKYHKGNLIHYYVSEIVPDDAAYVQVDASGAKFNGTIEATLNGDTYTADVNNLALTSITVQKQWENDPGYYGGNGYVDVALLADDTVYKTAQIRAAEDWKYTFNDLPMFNADGSRIDYTVVENTSLAEYNTANGGQPVVDYSQLSETGTIIIKNVLDPLTLTVNKQWLGDPEGTKHNDITVNILSSVDLKGTASSVFDRIRKVLGVDSNKWYQYSSVTLGEANGWTTQVNDLPRYAKVGNEVVKVSYAIEEPDVPEGYTSVTNVDGEIATVINTGYTSVAGFKTWDDGSNVVGYRPGSAEFASLIGLYQDGKQYSTGADAAHFRWLDTAGDTWSFEFYDLPSGHTYTIGELARVLGYGDPVIDGYTIRNPLEFTEIGVTKVWDDMDNAYASRPASIAFRLLANGAQANIAGVTPIVTLDNVNGASYIWRNLPVNDRNGNKIAYNVEEVSVPAGYTANVRRDGDMFTITNSYRPADTQISVTKVWDDQNDAAGVRPTSIQVALVRNGADLETVTLSAANGWTYTWSGLPTVLSDGSGTPADYSVREVSQILGYTVSITGGGEVYTITNYYREPNTPPTPPDNPPEEEGTTRGGSRTPTQPPYTIPDEPTPLAGISEVLGARRAPNANVLGARRSPQTGDASNAAAFVAAMASAGAMMGAWFSMRKRKKG